jgi:hypothetical protein
MNIIDLLSFKVSYKTIAKKTAKLNLAVFLLPGDDLLSHKVTLAVPLAH